MNVRTLQTVGLVTVVTLLIWLLAESQTLQQETVRMSVRVNAGELDDRLVRVLSDATWSGSIEVDVQGAAGSFAALQEAVRSPIELSLGEEISSEVGERDLDIRQALAAHELFAQSGRSIRRVWPDRVRIEVDERVTVSLGVLPEPGGVVPERPPVATPKTVNVSLPASVAELLPERAVARIPGEDAERLTPGEEAVVTEVPVMLPDLPLSVWGLSMEPSRVAVTIVPRRRTLSVPVMNVPLRVIASTDLLSRYEIELVPGGEAAAEAPNRNGASGSGGDQAAAPVVTVRVTGSSASVEQVRSGERAIAVGVTVSAEMAEIASADPDGFAPVSPASVVVLGLPATVSGEVQGEGLAVRVTPRDAE